MKMDFRDLPQNKQEDLQRIVAIVREHCPSVGMIILFGSYARGDWREMKDLAPDRKSGHPSDYDILVITQDEEPCDSQAWQAITEACAEVRLTAIPRFIHHDIEFVNGKLERGQYFFADIVAEGRLLYNADLFELASQKELQPEERLQIAQEDFAEWFESSEQFQKMHQFCMDKGWLKKAAFNLHQAAEAAYKTFLLVFTGHIPNEHYLSLLGDQSAKIDPAFQTVFQSKNSFERDAFTALEFAYIGARYDKRYTIDEPTVTYLAERVEALLRLTEARCHEKISALQLTAPQLQ
jgi:uncharacterized protein